MLAGAALALLTTASALRSGLWDRPLSMDNRLYFHLAERAASGVAPHVSVTDVKSQLSTLADAASISVGRAVGLHDVRAGRLGVLALLILGVWGVGCSVLAMGASGGAAMVAALSVLASSNLLGHAVVGFNPKILLFTFLAWGPWFLARGHFAWGGAAATAATLCWQPAAVACMAAALGALASANRIRALAATIAGGVVVFALYESYFAWHGVVAAQLFQTWALPLGSVHEAPNWVRGASFVIFGSPFGIDRFGIPGISFVLFALGSLARLAGVGEPASARMPAPAVVLIVVAGSVMCWFTAYEHQAEPDRFLLVAYFSIAFGLVVDSVQRYLRRHAWEHSSYQLEGALMVFLLFFVPRLEFEVSSPAKRIDGQVEAASIVAMNAEAHGGLWAYGCYHLMGLANLDNHHPLALFWDDLRRYVDETTFEPLAHGRLPNAILRCRGLPGDPDLLKKYTQIPLPGLAERAQLFVKTSALAAPAAAKATKSPKAISAPRSEAPGAER